MSFVLVDSSIWIDYLKKDLFSNQIDSLIQNLKLTTCGAIKAEIFPFVRKNRKEVENFFDKMNYFPFEDSLWKDLIKGQDQLIKNGMNNLSIPDLIIALLCKKNKAQLFTKDKGLIKAHKILDFDLFTSKAVTSKAVTAKSKPDYLRIKTGP